MYKKITVILAPQYANANTEIRFLNVPSCFNYLNRQVPMYEVNILSRHDKKLQASVQLI
jgi:hypothetical protein